MTSHQNQLALYRYDEDKNIWKSVLLLSSEPNDHECTTVLVYDVHKDENGRSFLYLVLPWHFEFKQGTTYHLKQSYTGTTFLQVDSVTFNQFQTRFFEDAESSVVIYKIQLKDHQEWNVGLGIASRIMPTPRAKRPRRANSDARPVVEMVCRTPVFGYDQLPKHVCIYGCLDDGRWKSTATVSTVDRLSFTMDQVLAPGVPVGAIVTNHIGVVVGIVNRVDTDNKNHSTRLHACSISSLPRRPSTIVERCRPSLET